MEEYFWFINLVIPKVKGWEKWPVSLRKKLENLHLPFSVVLGKSYFLYPKENPKSSHFFSIWISIYFSHAKYFDVILYI